MSPYNYLFTLPKLFRHFRYGFHIFNKSFIAVLFAEEAEHGVVLDAFAVSCVVVHDNGVTVVGKITRSFEISVCMFGHTVNYLDNALYITPRFDCLYKNIGVAGV